MRGNLLAALLASLVFVPPPAGAATIDRMYSAWSTAYSPAQGLVLHGMPTSYALSDGTSWNSGAGSFSFGFGTGAAVAVDGGVIRYTLLPPASGVLFQHTDYDGGDHSAQGSLGVAGPLVVEATLGGGVGVMQGYVSILSNDETWYGQPRFNFYSAAVGDKVYFQQSFSLGGTTFDETLFSRDFGYSMSGVVDFTKVQSPVPEPSTAWFALVGLVGIGLLARRRGEARRPR